MSGSREFSHITLTCTPFKKKIDAEARKSEMDIEKDASIAQKCADRYNYNTNLYRKMTLSDRFELTAFGFEMKAKKSADLRDAEEGNVYIYRKDRKQDNLASPIPAGLSPQNPLPAGRGFLSPPLHAAFSKFSVSPGGSGKSSPRKSPPAVVRPPNALFDDIPSNFV